MKTTKDIETVSHKSNMVEIFFNDGVNPSTCVHTCSTLEEAKSWVSEQLKGYTLADDNHKSTENVMASSKTAKYEVYNGEPITLSEDGEPTLAEPIKSDYFYTE